MTSAEARRKHIEKTVLANGLRVVTEYMPQVRSVSFGVWVDGGSRHETARQSGISHFIEHMVFKGTSTRSAEDIACSVDAIGGHLDAFTTKENVAFTAKVLDEHLSRAMDIVSDLVLDPVFRDEDIAKEKTVILEELKMDEDNPDYLIHEIFSRSFWKGHALGRPIIGSQRTINSFERRQIRGFFRRTYEPRKLLITAAGNIRHSDFVRVVEDRFGGLKPRETTRRVSPPKPVPSIVLHNKPSLEQVHICLGLPTHAMADPRRYASFVLNTVLGGGVSSRLFLKIRERAGLVYSVFSDFSLYADVGCLSVYAGTSLEAVEQVIAYVLDEFRDLKQNRVSDEELRRAKDHLKGSLMLSLESTSSRMSNLARQEKYLGEFLSLDEVTGRIEAVEAPALRELANQWFHRGKIALTILGNLAGFRFGREKLAC